jgi:L-ascorbate metabolism protein UlaG (beta-lactamase superfamily)
MQTKVFGKKPEGERLSRIESSVNYKNGSFQNLSPTEVTLNDVSVFDMLQIFFNKPKNATPELTIPSVKTDLKKVQADKPLIIWFGHSSYLIKSEGIYILVDPVLHGNASPVSFFGKSFKGTDIYDTEDFPFIDMIIITHDHYDHLDYKTISEFKEKTKFFYTTLGVGAHLEHWGVDPQKIVELDWWDKESISTQNELIATPARHFSGRAFKRSNTLWTSYVLKLHGYTLMIGGDSGYDTHLRK